MSYQLVRQAILDRKSIRGVYSGRYREMTPHVIGTNKYGRQQALCYQFGGESSSRPIEPDGSAANWRCVEMEKLSNVEFMDGVHTAPDHSRPQTCVANIDVEVQY
jgi:hypothetical protein